MGNIFQPTNDAPANKGTYGFPLPPNAETRVAPPKWENFKLITSTTSSEVVPQNVYQMLALVWGGGMGGNNGSGGGSGGGDRSSAPA